MYQVCLWPTVVLGRGEPKFFAKLVQSYLDKEETVQEARSSVCSKKIRLSNWLSIIWDNLLKKSIKEHNEKGMIKPGQTTPE